MNQKSNDSNDSVKLVVNPKKSLYSCLIALANRKRKKVWNLGFSFFILENGNFFNSLKKNLIFFKNFFDLLKK